MASARLPGNRRAVLRGLRRGPVQVTPSQQVGAYCGCSSAQRAGSPGQELTTQSTDQPANGTLHLIRAWQGYGSGAIDGVAPVPPDGKRLCRTRLAACDLSGRNCRSTAISLGRTGRYCGSCQQLAPESYIKLGGSIRRTNTATRRRTRSLTGAAAGSGARRAVANHEARRRMRAGEDAGRADHAGADLANCASAVSTNPE